MFYISKVRVLYFNDSKIDVKHIISYLIGLKVLSKFDLKLQLLPDRKLIQSNNLIKPPIRWLDSLDFNSTFEMECEVVENEVSFMPGNLQRISKFDGKYGLFLKSNSRDIKPVS